MRKKSIDVFGLKVPIKYYVFDEENKDLLGFCQKSPMEIHINSAYPNDAKQSLSHEIVHAILFRIGLDQVLSVEIQELLAESFGNFISENYNFKGAKK